MLALLRSIKLQRDVQTSFFQSFSSSILERGTAMPRMTSEQSPGLEHY
jgi:hypothetical protein